MKLDQQLYRIGNDIVAVYLVVTDDGVTVVDAGMAGHWGELTAELAAWAGLRPTSAASCSPMATPTTSASRNGSVASTGYRSSSTAPMPRAHGVR
ncbi:hypothetical protein MBT84_45215 [Streptomyces sp. MBT84]|uniref:hypothetical protein n=1 Tax=Streptomyces sp. MBT84 TaxID=1488414 RepID=UPI001DAB22A0|nr:hypothetical protein [Streptomyces sp. MBT84]MBW8706853.1 hypothetical protein [Streptomyces sp. MBT84]